MKEVSENQLYQAIKGAEFCHLNMDDVGWKRNGVLIAKRTGKRSRNDVERFYISFDELEQVRIPNGWVLVPVEPTYQMAEAFGVPWESGDGFPQRWQALISSSPKYNGGSNG